MQHAHCASVFSIANGRRNVITAPVRGKHHQNMARACSSQSVTSFFRPQTPQSVIQAESLRSTFVEKNTTFPFRPVIMLQNYFSRLRNS